MNARASFLLVGRRGRYERLLQRHLDAVDRLLATLDAEDGDDDAEDGADFEPSLAGFNPLGNFDDREADDGGVYADEEPSLGSLGGTATSHGSQLGWAGGDTSELEDEHDGTELPCEDEDAQCEDEGSYRDGDDEPDDSGVVPTYPNAHDQRAPWPGINGVDGYGLPLDPDDDPREVVLRCEVGLS